MIFYGLERKMLEWYRPFQGLGYESVHEGFSILDYEAVSWVGGANTSEEPVGSIFRVGQDCA